MRSDRQNSLMVIDDSPPTLWANRSPGFSCARFCTSKTPSANANCRACLCEGGSRGSSKVKNPLRGRFSERTGEKTFLRLRQGFHLRPAGDLDTTLTYLPP